VFYKMLGVDLLFPRFDVIGMVIQLLLVW